MTVGGCRSVAHADVLAVLRTRVDDGPAREVESAVRTLSAQNEHQWELEDESRRLCAAARFHDVGVVKALIDDSNGRRLELVHDIDRIVASLAGAGPPERGGSRSRRFSDSFGQLCDRLTVEATRCQRAPDLEFLTLAEERYHHLLACTAELLDALLAGSAELAPDRLHKIYPR